MNQINNNQTFTIKPCSISSQCNNDIQCSKKDFSPNCDVWTFKGPT